MSHAANRIYHGLVVEIVLSAVDLQISDQKVEKSLFDPLDEREGATTLGQFLEQYIAKRSDLKGGTLINYKQVKRNLLLYFKGDTPLRDITEGDADEWRLWMLERLSENTVRRHCGRA